MKKIVVLLLVLLMANGFIFAGGQDEASAEGDEQLEIVMVVKLEGEAWFDNMKIQLIMVQDFRMKKNIRKLSVGMKKLQKN